MLHLSIFLLNRRSKLTRKRRQVSGTYNLFSWKANNPCFLKRWLMKAVPVETLISQSFLSLVPSLARFSLVFFLLRTQKSYMLLILQPNLFWQKFLRSSCYLECTKSIGTAFAGLLLYSKEVCSMSVGFWCAWSNLINSPLLPSV